MDALRRLVGLGASLAGTGKARTDSRLLRAIHRQWRFRPADGAEDGRAWQRVRLTGGDGSGPTRQVQPLPL